MSSNRNNLRSKSQAQNSDKLVNFQRREKLKNLLITKFMKKYAIKDPEVFLNSEVSNFLKTETLSEADLKILDDRIKSFILKKNEEDNLKQNLLNQPSNNNSNPSNKLLLPDIDINRMENMSVRSKHSKMSGVSHLSKHSELKRRELGRDDDELSSYSQKIGTDRIEFNDEGDEWNAIAKFNQKMFQEERKNNKYKEFEIKKRTKEELDGQVKDKLRRVNDEYKKNKEYDNILLKHVEFLTQLEKDKYDEMKAKIYKDKENRDIQLKEEKKRKKEEKKKEKEIDKEIGSIHNNLSQ